MGIGSLFAEAQRRHQAGQLFDADRLYRQILEAQPHHAEAVHGLGVIALQAGHPGLAAAIIGEAILLDASKASFHANLGIALHSLDRTGEAEASFLRALAIQPDYAEAQTNLGNLYQQLGRPAQAAACFREAIRIKPGFAEPHCGLGGALFKLEQWDEALRMLDRALALRPDFAEAFTARGTLLRDQGRLDKAAADFERAIALAPGLAMAHTGLGHLLRGQGRLDEAVARHAHAVALNPGAADAHNGLGIALHDLGRFDEAIAGYRDAIRLKPDYAEAHSNLGLAWQQQGDLEAAIACHRRALAIQPDNPGTHYNLAEALLTRGDWDEGWREYEWRWRTRHMAPGVRGFTQPVWRGEPAAGKTLLLHGEQGLGDSLQFCRYAPLTALLGLRVVVEVPAPLVRLLRGLEGVAEVIARGGPLPDFDFHCPLLGLPLAFGTRLDTVPATLPYLHADPAQTAAWRARIDGPGITVGLAWAGNPYLHSPVKALVDRRRSLPPDRLAPLFEVPGVHFVSLQKDGPKAPSAFALTDVMDEMTDFADTAALAATLDLVISVDTAVAHLAAALGKPVWLLNRFDSCWRWQRGRDDSPWYPRLRQFRQPVPGDWETVIARIAAELRALAAR